MPESTLRQPLPVAPAPRSGGVTLRWSERELEAEAERLERTIAQPDRWGRQMCRAIAPLTLEINHLKRQRNAIILAHSYQTPDIVYGVADKVGDSYGLSKEAMEATEDTIVFSSVRFMAETAKILNPEKQVLLPAPDAGCSLADGITAADVRRLKEEHPGVPVMCYVNTTAAVKAECDVCCTSSNFMEIARNLPGDQLIFVPDVFMGRHLQKELQGEKTVYLWDAVCEVHEQFDSRSIQAWREEAEREGRSLKVLVHPECDGSVLTEADFIGSTEKMMEHARKLEAEGITDIMPVTECGTADRMRAEMPALQVHGACVMCRHMKRSDLAAILSCLQEPSPEQVIDIDPDTATAARHCLDKMFEYQ